MGNTNMPTSDERTSILCFGDSQSEGFDYGFANDARYVTYQQDNRVGFVSGWSTRGLAKPANKQRILDAVGEQLGRDDLDHCVVFLAFGSVDIEWNLAFKRSVQNDNPCTSSFLGEMTEAFTAGITELKALADERKGPALQVVLAFPFAPLPLPDDYIHRVYAAEPPTYDMIPRDERMELWRGFITALESNVEGLNVPIVDMTPVFEAQGASTFMNSEHEDHHPDFIKTQAPLAGLIADLGLKADLMPRPPLRELYAHVRRKMPKDPTAKFVVAPVVARPVIPQPSVSVSEEDVSEGEETLSSSPDAVVDLALSPAVVKSGIKTSLKMELSIVTSESVMASGALSPVRFQHRRSSVMAEGPEIITPSLQFELE